MVIIVFNHQWIIRWHWVLVNLLVIFVLLSLAYWQWQRAEQKQQSLATLAHWQTQQALSLNELIEITALSDSNLMNNDGVSMAFTGRWLKPYVWLLDNQTVKGRAGYDVLIPVQQIDSENPGREIIALVNLGWVAAPPQRSELPAIRLPDDVSVQGVYRANPDGLLLGKNVEDVGQWPMRLQKIDTPLLGSYLPETLLRGVIYQQQSSPFLVHYHPVVLPPERHKAYALQWFLLAIAALLMGLACARAPVPANDAEHKIFARGTK